MFLLINLSRLTNVFMPDLITIIIPYYKKRHFLKQTIDSILKQTYKNYEVILIYDDVDKADLLFVRSTLKKIKNFKIIVNKKNFGAGNSRNIGIARSKGKFIAFLDSDDIWHKDKLKYQIKFMKINKIKFSYTDYTIVNKNLKVIKIIKVPKIVKFCNLLFSCQIGLSTVIVSSELLKKNKFSNLKTQEDFLLWLKLSKKNITMLGINSSFTSWGKTNHSLSSSVMQKLKDAFLLYNKYLKFNFLSSLILVFFLSFNSLIKRFL